VATNFMGKSGLFTITRRSGIPKRIGISQCRWTH